MGSAFPDTPGSEALCVMGDLGPRAILTAAGVAQCAPVTTRLTAPSAEQRTSLKKVPFQKAGNAAEKTGACVLEAGPSGVTAVMTQPCSCARALVPRGKGLQGRLSGGHAKRPRDAF